MGIRLPAPGAAGRGRTPTLTFLVELGPPPYAITGADGYELSDRWEEAQVMLRQVRALWASTAPA